MYLIHHISLVILLAVIAVLWKKYDDLKQELHSNQESKQSVSAPGLTEDDINNKLKGKDSYKETNITSFVWCFNGIKENICRFQNLCYNGYEEEFVFFGPQFSNSENMIEVSSSSVLDFNGHIFTVTNLPSTASHNFTINWIKRHGFIMTRFKSDNLMHVFHDDIIPLYHTLELLNIPKGNNSKFNIQLIFIDGWDPGEFRHLYESLAISSPIYTTSKYMAAEGTLTCFSAVYVGLSRTTSWYQYGYLVPQGPLKHSKVSFLHIKHAIRYLIRQLDTDTDSKFTESEYLVLLSRKENRRILNEANLMSAISKHLGVKVIAVGLETHSINELISLVRKSLGIVGIHGSLLILSIFLPPGSVIIELYPYAVNPNHYTPYKTLANIPRMDIVYKAWRNPRKDNSVGHPDWPPELGGINHLDEGERTFILEQTEVPEHLCCEDPSWLYHIYQDTIVEIPDVVELLHSALNEAKPWRVASLDNRLLSSGGQIFPPANVKNLECMTEMQCENGMTTIELSWKPPWNLIYLNFRRVTYEVLFQKVNEQNHIMYVVSDCFIEISNNVLCDTDYSIWVRAVLDNHIHGSVSYVICNT